jgi:hypothetical protein
LISSLISILLMDLNGYDMRLSLKIDTKGCIVT